MNDEARDQEPEEAVEETAADASGEPVVDGATGSEPGSAPADDASRALEAALEEAARMKDAALRAQAEMENVRRRSARDVEAAHKFALEKFATGLLPVVDSLEKSVEAVAGHEGGDEAIVAIKEGIQLSERMFMDTLGKFGVERIDPLGEPFDPERHEAMSMIEAPDAEPNTVVTVLQKGYALNGRLLRAAMVIVARSG
ncbi:MAG: nucleotide exchange factor GrpE [Pseudomonadales bacterium]|jgi:molecular chaperone GrpE|nr:nucleotide exchange factor GrpE [Pseudomonadales bacterium]